MAGFTLRLHPTGETNPVPLSLHPMAPMTTRLTVLAILLVPGGLLLSQQPPVNRTGLIAGQVIDAMTGTGLAESIVTLSPGSPAASPAAVPATRVITDSRGRFVFTNLARGAYRLGVIKPGYRGGGAGQEVPRGIGQVLELGDGERLVDIRLRAWKHASLSGRVVDEAGDPIVGAPVRVWRSLDGGRRLSSVLNGAATTDDRGIYRVGELEPGSSYVVGVSSISTTVPSPLLEDFFRAASTASAEMQLAMRAAAPTASAPASPANRVFGDHVLQVQGALIVPPDIHADGSMSIYRSTFYPRAATSAAAEVLTLRAGEQRTGIDFGLQPVRAIAVSGNLESASGPVGLAPVQLLSAPELDGTRGDAAIVATTVSDATGRFTFLAVPPGRYQLRSWKEPVEQGGVDQLTTVQTPGGTVSRGVGVTPGTTRDQPTWWTRMPLTVGEKPVAGLRVVMERGFRVSGQVKTDPAGQALPRRPQVVLESYARESFPSEALVGADGAFMTPEMPGSTYRFALPLPAGWHVKSVVQGGRDLADLSFELNGHLADLVVTISTRGARLSGSVMHEASVAPGARVIIFSADPRHWVHLSAYERRLKEATAGRDGRYAFADLPAGDYLIVAGTMELVNWDRPDLLVSLSKLASRLTLAEGETRSLDLRVVTSK